MTGLLDTRFATPEFETTPPCRSEHATRSAQRRVRRDKTKAKTLTPASRKELRNGT
jgi:hypothetical protein